jgi:hypothetical protein
MEGSVLSFLKAEWKVRDTGSAHWENGLSISEKIANDIYIIFQFLEGANNMSELRQCISKSPCRLTVASCEDHDSLITQMIPILSIRLAVW